MAWGDWFRLIPKGEATKLARVRIDFPSSLDEAWTIDIKKSRAKPPLAVRDRLKQIIDSIANHSTKVHRKRGSKLFEQIQMPIWERYADRGGVRYALNEQHPLVDSLIATLDEAAAKKVKIYMDAIVSSIPLETIYSDFSSHPHKMERPALDESDVFQKLQDVKNCLSAGTKPNAETFRRVVNSMRILDDYADSIEEFILAEFD